MPALPLPPSSPCPHPCSNCCIDTPTTACMLFHAPKHTRFFSLLSCTFDAWPANAGGVLHSIGSANRMHCPFSPRPQFLQSQQLLSALLQMMALAAGPLTPLKDRGDGADGEGGSGDDQQDKGQTWEGTEPLGGTAAGDFTKSWFLCTVFAILWRLLGILAPEVGVCVYCLLYLKVLPCAFCQNSCFLPVGRDSCTIQSSLPKTLSPHCMFTAQSEGTQCGKSGCSAMCRYPLPCHQPSWYCKYVTLATMCAYACH